MRKHYDFSKAKKNPYAKRLKRSVTIRLDDSTVEYFKALAEETELPYQTLINLYLRDCAASGRKLALTWLPAHEAAE
jgi:predicted DNA binding CopG/RHH family protein